MTTQRRPATHMLLLVGLLAVGACEDMCDPPPDDHGPVAEDVMAPLGAPVPYASEQQRAIFERGHDVATKRFDLEDGLGPAFNVTFCASCHEKPVVGGGAGLYRNFFLTGVRTDDGAFLPGESFGRAGGVVRMYYYGEDEAARPAVPARTNVIAQRNAIPFFGVGLLAEIAEEEILKRADPSDLDGDGISGRPNYEQGFVGRFGLKAQTVSIEGFIRGPVFNHLGVTSDPLTEEQKAALPVDSSSTGVRGAELWLSRAILPFGQAAAPAAPLTDDDAAPDPEMSPEELFDLVSFAMLLAAPEIEPIDDQKRRGLRAFDAVGCRSCHTPRLESPRGPLPVYSDLLLHDMGPELADGIEQGEATGSEFRTQPLWGLSAVGPYLHDGRAQTIDEAIRMHGGEAQGARDRYLELGEGQRTDLHEFLLSLGGRAQRTEGLLPPNAPLPGVGEYGGPVRELSADEEARFLAGRALFDKDFGFSEGVGLPRFNGDSCRACHFDPVIGGAGPRDVNVIRHGVVDDDGVFSAPAIGTILHKETTLLGDVNRPQEECNVFEHRQTPHLFGLGLIDALDEGVIVAHADPDDTDGDGISGRVSVTSGDRVGRFGWKAQVPSLAEFVRDAMTAELGLSLEPQDGLTFGVTQDADDVIDPELSRDDAEVLLDYLHLLAPPPREPAESPALVDEGELVFDTVGCTKCHVPSLDGPSGPVPLYSDLLLHEILPPEQAGIVDTSANMWEMRTAPLWGLSTSAPYLHSGAADTVDQAIRAHDGEAAAIRDAYEDLPEDDREALLQFLSTL